MWRVALSFRRTAAQTEYVAELMINRACITELGDKGKSLNYPTISHIGRLQGK